MFNLFSAECAKFVVKPQKTSVALEITDLSKIGMAKDLQAAVLASQISIQDVGVDSLSVTSSWHAL